MRQNSLYLASTLLAIGSNTSLFASGHGPVFGMATPTNAAGGWSFDTGIMSRVGVGGSGTMLRGMLAYGVTEDLQVSLSVPYVFSSAPFVPARITGMMPASGDVEGCVASTVLATFRELVEVVEGPSIKDLSKTIKHSLCSTCRRCNTSPWTADRWWPRLKGRVARHPGTTGQRIDSGSPVTR